jgi:beta-phosphoglucomutase-like phosphatase (HAD superfamily)
MIRALIFDFDGLILETEAPIYQAWLEVYQAHGFPLPFETWATIIGTAEATAFDPYRELERMAGRRLDWEALDRQRCQHEQALIEAQPILPGVEQYLQHAGRLGLKVGLASSSSSAWVTGHLARLGLLEHFQAIRASDDVQHTKPDLSCISVLAAGRSR